MRILYVSHSFPVPNRPLSNVGGMQRVAVGLFRALQANRDVEVESLVLETSWRWTGARTPLFLMRLVGEIPRRVRRDRVDVVLFSSMVTAAVLPLVAGRIRRAGAITAVIPVGRDVTLPNPVYQRLVPKILAAADVVLPISTATAAACATRGATPGSIHVVPCGVDLQPPPSPEARSASRARLLDLLRSRLGGLPADPLLLLSVGRHQERKGFLWFVDQVIPGLRSRFLYLLAGSGPMTPAIEAALERRGIGDRVALLGQVSEDLLKDLYLGSDIFVMPNIPVPGDIEGFGVVMLEAGAVGLPVVAADLEGIRDVISEGENGALVQSGDADGFVTVIDAYADRDLRATASASAARHVRETFGWDAVAARHVAVLEAARTLHE